MNLSRANLLRASRLAGLAGAALLFLGLIIQPTQAFRSYWLAWLCWSGIGLGCFAGVCLQTLTGGRWAEVLEAPAQAALATLPWLLFLALPVLVDLPAVFPWASGDSFQNHPSWVHHRQYLQGPWFAIRLLLYFVALYFLFRKLRAPRRASQFIGGLGAVIYVLTMNFASTDWVMSLEPAWYSTIFAVIFMATQFLSGLAFCVLMALWQTPTPPAPKTMRDLGNLLMAFIIFWAYVSFSQFLIIWSGDLPREISWYVHRRSGGWPWIALLLGLAQFLLPFILLLSRAVKQAPRRLRRLAALILFATGLNWYWLVVPSYSHAGLAFHWLDAAALLGLGGVWFSVFLGKLKSTELCHV